MHHHSKVPGGPLENKGKAFVSSFSFLSSFLVVEGGICLPVTHGQSLINVCADLYGVFFSCLMQFFSGTSANSGCSGFAVLCVDNSAFARSCGDADAVRTSTSFSKHHCWTHNHSKECPLCQHSPQGLCAETLISRCLENPLFQLSQIYFHLFRWLFK